MHKNRLDDPRVRLYLEGAGYSGLAISSFAPPFNFITLLCLPLCPIHLLFHFIRSISID